MRRTPSRRLLAAALLVASAPAPMATTPATAAPAPPPPGLRLRHANTFRPGADFQYSNSNLVRLGLVIEKVTGRKLADVIHERVLRPAGLRHTLYPQGDGFPEPHPRGYIDQTLSGEVEDVTDLNRSWAWAAGAMISDLHDLCRWAKVVATGELLGPETQAQRLRTLPTGYLGTDYGLGVFETNGWIGHNGSIPGYETVTVYLPSSRRRWSS